MRTYIINGYIVPVTNKEHAELNDLRDAVLIKMKDRAELSDVLDAENAYNKRVYDLYKAAWINGIARHTDAHFIIREDNGKYTSH